MATLTNSGQGLRSALPNRPFGFTATAGRLLLLWVSGRNSGGPTNPGPPTDDPDWQFLGYNRTFNPVGFQDCCAVFGLVAKGGETSFDPKTSAPGTFPGSSGGSYFIQEWGGAGLVDLIVVNANKVGSGVNLRGTEFEADGAGTAIGFFVQSQDNVKTFTPVAGWTIDDDHSSSAHPAECLVSSDTLDGETYQPAATSNRNNGWRSITLLLGDAEPPPPPVTPPLVCAVDDEDLSELVCIGAEELVDWSIRTELQGTGSGYVVIHRSHLAADTDVIKKGNWMAVKIPQIDDEAIFVFQMERITTTLISNEEGGGEVVKVAGRGNLSYFDRAIALPRTYASGSGESDLSVDGIINGPAATGNKAGQVLQRAMLEWQHVDRGVSDFGLRLEPIAHVTHDFDYDDDSSGDPWDTTDMTGELSLGYVGEKGLVGILELIGTGAIDIVMWPTFLLQAFNSYGRDLTGADFDDDVVRFVRGVNIAEELVRDEGLVVDPTHTVVQGSDGTTTAWAFAESPVYGSQPHVEGHVSTFGTDNTALEAVGVAEMARRIRQGEAIQFRVATPRFGQEPDPTNGLYLCGPEGTNGNYWLGDFVTLDTGSGFRDYADLSVRVMAITIKSDQAGDLEVIAELKGTTLNGRLIPSTGSFGGFGGSGGSLGGSGAGGTGGSSAPPPPSGSGVAKHVADPDDAHDASAISVVPFGTIAADNVQDALEEIVDEAGADAILRHTGAAEWFLDHGNAGAAETINLTLANQHWITLDDDCTLIFTGAVADIDGQDVGSSFTLYVEQDGTGGREITWPGSVQWPGGTDPVLSTDPGSVDILTFLTPDGGTTWYGFFGVAPIGLADTVVAETTFGLAADAGVASQASRSDHTHGTPDEPEGGSGSGTAGFLLLADVHGSPIVFDDILQADDFSDLLYSEA